MIVLESILLWTVAACALAMIMAQVLKSPQTHERPKLGLGKRFPVSTGRKRHENRSSPLKSVDRRPARTNSPTPPLPQTRSKAVSEAGTENADMDKLQAEEPVKLKRKTKRSTDTMQFMLNKAMAERR